MKSQELADREERIIAFLRQGLPIANIAALEGLEINTLWRTCRGIIRTHGIEYKSNTRAIDAAPPGMTDATAAFRNKLGTQVYRLREVEGISAREVSQRTGLPARAQGRAMNGSRHDWTISQMERLADANGESFKELIVESLMSAEDLPAIIQKLIPPLRKQTAIQREAVKCSISLLNSSH